MLMLDEGELCVCELTCALGEIQPKISRHLASLRDSRIVLDRRAGQWIYYRINPKLPAWAIETLKATFKGMKSEKILTADIERLKKMSNRPDNKLCN
jgi:ArsR family transcriptional regulator